MTTEAEVIAAVRARYANPTVGAARYTHITQARTGSLNDGHNLRALDLLILDRWLTRGHREIHGIEVKTSRSDWLREKRNPTKAAAWSRHCHRFYIATPAGIINDGELPPGWGHYTLTPEGTIETSVRPKLTARPTPLPGGALADLMYQAIRTAPTTPRR